MKPVDFSQALNQIDDELIDDAETFFANKKPSGAWGRFRKISLVAATIAVAFATTFFSITAEAKEYNAALNFFTQNQLSTEGLTRAEIKGVYRDITTEQFSYGKTAYVIKKSVVGYDISQPEPSPDDLQRLWEYRNNQAHLGPLPLAGGAEYSLEYLYANVGSDIAVTRKGPNGILWRTEVANISSPKYVATDSAVFVFGSTHTWSSERKYGRLVMLDLEGNIVWEYTSAHDIDLEYYNDAVCDQDGIAVFGFGLQKNSDDHSSLCYTRFDYSGQVVTFTQHMLQSVGFVSAVGLDEGYLLKVKTYKGDEFLLKANRDGSFGEALTYTDANEKYYIADMISYGGRIYLSAYCVPKLREGESDAGGREEIAAILNEIWPEGDNHPQTPASEDLTARLRQHYTAVLLICEPASGVPEKFYSVKGSLGGRLAVDDGRDLLWDVQSITSSFYSPLTSSFSIGGECCVYRYQFNPSGGLESQENAGEVTDYRR